MCEAEHLGDKSAATAGKPVYRHPLVEELIGEGRHPHVVEAFLTPLAGALQWGAEDPRIMLRAMRDELACFETGVLAEAAAEIRGSRTKWPSPALARQACLKAQQGHALYRIERGTPEWDAWLAHYRRIGKHGAVRYTESEGYTLQRTKFPPADGGTP